MLAQSQVWYLLILTKPEYLVTLPVITKTSILTQK